MDNLPPELTDALRSRIWAAFKQLHHKYRNKQIGRNECIREAYIVCARELPSDSAVALVVHYGRALKWFPKYRQTGRAVVGYFAGMAPTSPPSPDPVYQPIPEADQRARVAEIVADLIEHWRPEVQAAGPAGGQHASADRAVDVPGIVALQDRVVRTQGISIEQWARDHHISHTALYEWRRAGGKAVKGRVSTDKAGEIEAAVGHDALRLGLILAHTDSD